jgi:hypothetical protein
MTMTDRCLYFGCWNMPGHFLVGPGGRSAVLAGNEASALSDSLDGVFAPKRLGNGALVWGTGDPRDWYRRTANECPQGQFLRHRYGKWSLLQWWDRCQGDKRGACNSTILLEGDHTSAELLAALAEHFPHVLENLKRHGVELVELFP